MNCAIQENSGDRRSEGVEGKVIMERPQTAVFSPWVTAQGRGKQLTFRRVCQIRSGGRCST
eukprot:8584025-Ditylum_brightwellii.AAC.1